MAHGAEGKRQSTWRRERNGVSGFAQRLPPSSGDSGGTSRRDTWEYRGVGVAEGERGRAMNREMERMPERDPCRRPASAPRAMPHAPCAMRHALCLFRHAPCALPLSPCPLTEAPPPVSPFAPHSAGGWRSVRLPSF
jgi:hypothetical protein